MTLKMSDIQNDMVKWRRALHQIPELGNNLPQTVSYVSGVLKEIGVEHEFFVEGNAIVATVSGKGEGAIALRADMDALPIREESGLEFASTNGNMHACGHDGHIAMLLGAVKYINSKKDELNGTVKFFFQPGEEGYFGAKKMIEDGVLDKHKVDRIFGIHNGNIGDTGNVGEITFRKGPIMASSNTFKVVITGKGAHGAYPHLSLDPITAQAELIMAIQHIKSREISSDNPCVITVGTVHGGTKENIIPEKVEISGTIRTYSEEVLSFINKRLGEICKGIELTNRVKIEYKMEEGYPPTINDDEFTEFAFGVAKDLFGEKATYLKHAVMGAEDMSFFLNAVGGTYAFLSNPNIKNGERYPNHHPKFDLDETCFEAGALLLAEVAIRYLNLR